MSPTTTIFLIRYSYCHFSHASSLCFLTYDCYNVLLLPRSQHITENTISYKCIISTISTIQTMNTLTSGIQTFLGLKHIRNACLATPCIVSGHLQLSQVPPTDYCNCTGITAAMHTSQRTWPLWSASFGNLTRILTQPSTVVTQFRSNARIFSTVSARSRLVIFSTYTYRHALNRHGQCINSIIIRFCINECPVQGSSFPLRHDKDGRGETQLSQHTRQRRMDGRLELTASSLSQFQPGHQHSW